MIILTKITEKTENQSMEDQHQKKINQISLVLI